MHEDAILKRIEMTGHGDGVPGWAERDRGAPDLHVAGIEADPGWDRRGIGQILKAREVLHSVNHLEDIGIADLLPCAGPEPAMWVRLQGLTGRREDHVARRSAIEPR